MSNQRTPRAIWQEIERAEREHRAAQARRFQELGLALSQARERCQLSQTEVGRRLDLDRSLISLYEQGKRPPNHKFASWNNWRRFVDLFGGG